MSSDLGVCNVALGGELSLRLYEGSWPRNLEIAPLQKGLIMVLHGRELVGEGTGFGVPVVKYTDATYFSRTATIRRSTAGDWHIFSNCFKLDTTSKKKAKYQRFVSNPVYERLRDALADTYRDRKRLRALLSPPMETQHILGIKSVFVESESRGEISATYEIHKNRIAVNIDLAHLDRRSCKEILILNEQGASFFRQYLDSDGLRLVDGQIGVWDRVKADEAGLYNPHVGIGFSLRKISGVSLYRGRELIKNRFDWVGLAYALEPDFQRLHYEIEIRGVDKPHRGASGV